MNYLDAVNTVGKMENTFDVMSIKCNGISIWPLLRINLIDRMCERDVTMKDNGNKAIKLVLLTLFKYNPFSILKKRKIWLFAGYERRRTLGVEHILRISGGISKVEPDTLVIEKPSQMQLGDKNKHIPEKHIISESWFLLFVHVIASLYKFKKLKVENESIIKELLSELGVKFDYYSSISLLIAQYKFVKLLTTILPCPKVAIIECPYAIMGYVWAFHKKNIPVIEMQHGVLNSQHYAYCSHYHSYELYPDEIWVFGEDEYNYLKSDKCHYCKIVKKTGLYFLEVANEFFKEDVFKEERKTFESIVLVAGQRGYEQVLASFVDEISCQSPRSCFIYVPRTIEEKIVTHQANVLYRPGINIYEYMKWCDFHLTISSTTAIECQYFHKPTIFYDYENLGTQYYGSVLNSENGAFYVNNVEEYYDAIDTLKNKIFAFKECFTPGTINIIGNSLKMQA